MTSLYFDTTYLGKLHWPEPGSSEVAACAAAADELVCALHGRAEFHSISHRKLREGLADAHATRVVCAQYDADCASGAIRLLLLTGAIVNRVAQAFATAPSTAYLRAADALHLAAAAEHGFTEIYSNDRHLLNAATYLGLTPRNVIP